MKKEIKIQKIESLDDLECLVKGDIIEIITHYHGLFSEDRTDKFVYHSLDEFERMQFVRFEEAGNDKYIIMQKASKSRVEIRNGKIVMDEDKCVMQSYIPQTREYSGLHETLKKAGME